MIVANGLARPREENNFNLIRIVAAYAVLCSHAYPIATGDPNQEPLRLWLGVTPGSVAVNVFFVASGFLVANSLTQRGAVKDFLIARILRLYPAIIVYTLASALFLGLAVSTLGWWAYVSHPETWVYVLKNATLIDGPAYNLPGVFDGNPLKQDVNGSLWTLPIEIFMYLLLLFASTIRKKLNGNPKYIFETVVFGTVVAGGILFTKNEILGVDSYQTQIMQLAFMFSCGAIIYRFRRTLALKWSVLAINVLLLAVSLVARPLFAIAYIWSIAHIVVCLAYLPQGSVWVFNRLGDYSYGLYIYAFPVEQFFVYLFPGLSPVALIACATPPTFALAAMSWWLIEQRALRLKPRSNPAPAEKT